MIRRSFIALAFAAAVLPSATLRAQDAGTPDASVRDAGTRRVDAGVLGDAGAATVDASSTLHTTELPFEHRPRLGMTITPDHGIMTGDVVHVTIAADALAGDDVALPQQAYAPFELHAQSMTTAPVQNGRHTITFRLELLILEPGPVTLPAITLRVATANGDIGNVATSPRPMRIGSVLGNTPNAQPKPPTQPVVVMEDDYTLAWLAGAVAALILTAIITLLVARYLRRRKKAAAPPPPPRPPWDVAMEKLNALRVNQHRLLAEGRMMEFVDGVSDAVREYLGNRFGFVGLESTTDEVIARLRHVGPLPIAREQIGALLSDCDLVKFAKAVPDDTQCAYLLDGAFQIVRATIPAAPVMRQEEARR